MEIDKLRYYRINMRPDTFNIDEVMPDNTYTDIHKSILNKRLSPNNKELVDYFTGTGLDISTDLYKLTDVDKAGELIAEHIKNNKHILILSDYDCDKVA